MGRLVRVSYSVDHRGLSRGSKLNQKLNVLLWTLPELSVYVSAYFHSYGDRSNSTIVSPWSRNRASRYQARGNSLRCLQLVHDSRSPPMVEHPHNPVKA